MNQRADQHCRVNRRPTGTIIKRRAKGFSLGGYLPRQIKEDHYASEPSNYVVNCILHGRHGWVVIAIIFLQQCFL